MNLDLPVKCIDVRLDGYVHFLSKFADYKIQSFNNFQNGIFWCFLTNTEVM